MAMKELKVYVSHTIDMKVIAEISMQKSIDFAPGDQIALDDSGGLWRVRGGDGKQFAGLVNGAALPAKKKLFGKGSRGPNKKSRRPTPPPDILEAQRQAVLRVLDRHLGNPLDMPEILANLTHRETNLFTGTRRQVMQTVSNRLIQLKIKGLATNSKPRGGWVLTDQAVANGLPPSTV